MICFWVALAVGVHACSPPVFSQQYNVGLHPKLFVLVLPNILGVISRQLNLGRGQLLLDMYQINRALFIHMPLINQLRLHEVNRNIILMKIIQEMYLMMMIVFLITSWENGVLK